MVSFSVPKTEVIYWRTPSQRTPQSTAPHRTGRLPLLPHPARKMAWLLEVPCPDLDLPLHAEAFAGPGSLCLRQMTILPRRSHQTFSLPPYRSRPPPSHTYLCGLPVHPELLRRQRDEQLLAQGPEMDHQCLLLPPNLHPSPRGVQPPIISYCKYKKRLAALRISYAPPTNHLATARVPAFFPSLSPFRPQDSLGHLTQSLSSVYLPLDWRTPVPSPLIREDLPVDALVHLTCPLQESLTRFPLILHPPLST